MKTLEIKKLRHRLGLTQAEFAELIGVNQATVSKWERNGGISRFALKTLERLKQEAA
jgi:DNA-binding transcriptional regulator YiaG